MLIIDLLFLIPIFIIGGVCSYTDIKCGKIRNNHIKYGLFSVVFIYISFFLYYNHQEKVFYFLLEMLLNGFIALISGYLLWYFKLWSAGDAKLFTLLALLIPLQFYSGYYLKYFSVFVLLANTFIIIMLFLIIEALIFFFKNRKKVIDEFKKIEWTSFIKTYLTFFISAITIKMAMKIIGQFFNLNLGSSLIPLFLFLFFARKFLIKRLLKNKKAIYFIEIASASYAIFLILTHQESLFINIIKTTFILITTITILIKTLDFYLDKAGTKEISIKNLQANMMVDESNTDNFKKVISENNLKEIYSSEIGQEKIDLLKKMFLNKPETKIKIHKTFYFAPFMLAGCIITIITKTFILSLILNLFN